MLSWHFITKPVGLDMLVAALRRATQSRALVMENRELRSAAAQAEIDSLILGESSTTVALRQNVVRIGEAGVDVLIEGRPALGRNMLRG